MSLLRRLVVLQVVLLAAGLAAFAGVSYSLYSRSTYQSLDNQLQSAAPGLAGGLARGHGPVPTCRSATTATGAGSVYLPPAAAPHNLPAGSFAELRTAAGQVENAYAVPDYSSHACRVTEVPALPDSLSPGSGPDGRYLTVGAVGGSTKFRVLVRAADAPFQGLVQPGSVLIVAIPLKSTLDSLHDLLLLDGSVGLAVLLLASLVGAVTVRRGLHPLARLAATARAVGAGDLSRRAPPADERTEVGQLGAAFNAMLGRIGEAFAARDSTEARLRAFLADASHELRTPLTSIRGYAELYRLGAVAGADLDALMARIECNAEQMGELVEELLLLAHLDRSRPLDRQPVDLTVLAAEMCSDLAVSAPDRRLLLDAPDPVIVLGDDTNLRRAVANLLGNAIRYSPPGSPIEVGVRTEGGAAVVQVRDHGPGFSSDGLAHAFDRFWREDRGAGEGSGLGLALVAAVAGAHRGDARVANAADGGAVVEIRLPIPDGQIPAGSGGPPSPL